MEATSAEIGCQRTCKDTKKKQFTTHARAARGLLPMSKNMQRYKKKAIHNHLCARTFLSMDVKEHAKIQKKSNSQPTGLVEFSAGRCQRTCKDTKKSNSQLFYNKNYIRVTPWYLSGISRVTPSSGRLWDRKKIPQSRPYQGDMTQ